MSHSLGPLADNLAAYAIYATAQTEMWHAYALIEHGDLAPAAAEIDSAARAAEVLACVSEPVDGGRAAHWRRVASARWRFAAEVRARAAEVAAEVPVPRGPEPGPPVTVLRGQWR